VDPGKTPLSLICLGKVEGDLPAVARKDFKEKVTYIR
jgi:hypothetical protein